MSNRLLSVDKIMQPSNTNSYGSGTVPPAEMAALAEEIVFAKAKKQPHITLVLAIMAGIFIAIAGMFYSVTMAGASDMPYGMSKLVGGLTFSTGLMLVILCGAELFTSSTLLLMGRATGRLSFSKIFKNWSLVYLGNFIGSIIFVLLIAYGYVWEAGHGQVGLSMLYIAKAKLGHGFVQDIILGLLCNLLVCLTFWLSLSSTSAAGKMMACVLPVAAFIAAGFEHSVANMYLLPVAMMIKEMAGSEFWHSIGYTAADFDIINIEMILHNLVPVTIGNILGGGVMIGLSKWFVHLRKR